MKDGPIEPRGCSARSPMTAQLIDGAALAAQLRNALKQRAAALTASGRRPGLAVILVGDDPASRVYVRNKIKACSEAGIHSELHELPADAPEAQVLAHIRTLNADPRIHGILVQLPLPRQVSEEKVLDTIAVDKDVDGLHAQNLGASWPARTASRRTPAAVGTADTSARAGGRRRWWWAAATSSASRWR
jgi:5,10-methylene-tetrahydrofolate dehydrogenase/methenyl tetrahydrofolate cyclohydrolase